MVELKGSEKQVKWAEDIRKNYLEMLDKMVVGVKEENAVYVRPIMNECRSEVMSKIKGKTHQAAVRVILEILTELKEKIEAEENSKKFIDIYNSHKYFAPNDTSAISILKEFR